MELLEYTKKRKIVLFVYIFLFIIFVMSLIFRNIKQDLYPLSIFLAFLIFLYSQYFDFEYRYFIIATFILLLFCPFLLIFKYKMLAEYFASYSYGFLVLGILGYFIDHLREKIKEKGYFKIYRIVFLFLIIILLISPVFIYKDNIKKLFNIINTNINVKKDDINLKNLKIAKKIKIVIDSPIEGAEVVGNLMISGWAIDNKSTENSGIDKIELFIDGKPGIGISLGSIYLKDNGKYTPLEEFITRLFKECYDKTPSDKDLILWTYRMRTDSNAINDVVLEFFSSQEFLNKNLNNEDYLKTLYRVLFNRMPDSNGYEHWLEELNNGLNRDKIMDNFLDSVEFKKSIRDYYKIDMDGLHGKINLFREDIGNIFGRQFEMSGFILNFDSNKFINGKHTLYVYCHSSNFGWNYANLNIYINN